MLKQDEEGRYPLSTREYQALRHIFGFADAMEESEALKDRLMTVKYGWRDMRLLASVAKRLMEKILRTVPTKKLKAMREEMRRTVCKVELQGAAGRVSDDLAVVPLDALVRVMDRAVQMDCTFCSKSGKEGKKCQLYRDLTACVIYDFDERKDGACPLAGSASIGEFEP